MFAAEIRKRRIHDRCYSLWLWHLDEAFVRINGEIPEHRRLQKFVAVHGSIQNLFNQER